MALPLLALPILALHISAARSCLSSSVFCLSVYIALLSLPFCSPFLVVSSVLPHALSHVSVGEVGLSVGGWEAC